MIKEIITPEGTKLSMTISNPFSRAYAFLIDMFIIIVTVNISISLLSIFSLVSQQLFATIYYLIAFIIFQGYYIYFEIKWNGQTPGKKIFKLRVVDANGLSLSFDQIIIRNIIKTIDALPYFGLLGGIVVFFSKEGKRLGDYAADTIVVHLNVRSEFDLKDTFINKYNSLRSSPHMCSKLKREVTHQEAELFYEAIARADELSVKPRIKLYDKLKDHIQSKVLFPNELINDISSEQYIKNVIDILFTKK
ncbi:MAG: RDD family protein [Planctomycetota bacterium]|nr:MAG: RDD family protein [Planctomycetota bacterium]